MYFVLKMIDFVTKSRCHRAAKPPLVLCPDRITSVAWCDISVAFRLLFDCFSTAFRLTLVYLRVFCWCMLVCLVDFWLTLVYFRVFTASLGYATACIWYTGTRWTSRSWSGKTHPKIWIYGAKTMDSVLNTDDLGANNDELCIKYDGWCIQNGRIVHNQLAAIAQARHNAIHSYRTTRQASSKLTNFASEMMNSAFKMMNFAFKKHELCIKCRQRQQPAPANHVLTGICQRTGYVIR